MGSLLRERTEIIGFAVVIRVFASLQIAIVSQSEAAEGTENEKDSHSTHFSNVAHVYKKVRRGWGSLIAHIT